MAKQQAQAKERDQIFRAWARGLMPETVASTYGLAVEEVKEIVRIEMEKQPVPSKLDPEEVLREHEVRLYALQEELAMIAPREKGLARTRAVEARFNVLKHLFEVRRAIGVLPNDLGQMAVYISGVQMAERVMAVLDEYGVPQEAYGALRRAIRPGRYEQSENGGVPPLPGVS
jgi:hypothetical protein